MSLRKVLRTMLVSSSEMLLAVAVVLVLGLVFMGILIVSFPEGSGLIQVYDSVVDKRSGTAQLDMTEAPVFVARLTHVERQVRDRPASAIAWRSAHEGTDLENRHTVQTRARSRASISILGESSLELGEESLIVIKRPERRRGTRERRAELVILGGSVRGTLGGAVDVSTPVDLVTPGGEAQIVPGSGDETEFSVTVGDDNSSTFSLFSGVAQIRTGDGMTELRANEAVTLSRDGTVATRVALPDPPVLLEPSDGLVLSHGSVAPEVEFAWDGPAPGYEFMFVLARDPDFRQIVHSEQLAGTRFTHGNLTHGRYYWQVRTLEGLVESRPSRTRELTIVTDVAPPRLEVQLPDRVDGTDRVTLRGVTEPGAELWIAGERIEAAGDGEFEHDLTLRPGMNMIVIEAVDASGNSSYHSQYVNAIFPTSEVGR